MISGLYAAANGMMAMEDWQAVVANNIANATTTGFKRQVAVQRGFQNVFFGELRDPRRFDLEAAPGGGLKTIQTFTNHTNGVISITGNPLDVAIMGPGLIRVATPNGERFTKSGRFTIDGNGQLITLDGHAVLDVEGESIDISGGPAQIDGQGIVTVNGEQRGQISVVEFDDPHMLEREGYTLFRASDEALELSRPAEATSLVRGSLEASNVQVPTEMAQMMLALRAYAANQQVIKSVDETLSRMIDQVGAPG